MSFSSFALENSVEAPRDGPVAGTFADSISGESSGGAASASVDSGRGGKFSSGGGASAGTAFGSDFGAEAFVVVFGVMSSGGGGNSADASLVAGISSDSGGGGSSAPSSANTDPVERAKERRNHPKFRDREFCILLSVTEQSAKIKSKRRLPLVPKI